MSKFGKDASFNPSVFKASFKNVIAKRSDSAQFKSGRLVAPAPLGGGALNTQLLWAGTAMGQVTASGLWIPYLVGAVDGSQVCKGILRDNTVYDSDNDGTAIVMIGGGCDLFQDLLVGVDAGAIASLFGQTYVENGINILKLA